MACSGCAQRREAIKAVARNVGATTKEVFSALRNWASTPEPGPGSLPVVNPKGEDAGRKVVQKGWQRRK